MARSELNELFQALLPFAQRMLTTEGGFHPFAASMSLSGDIALVDAAFGDAPSPSAEQIDEFLRLFRVARSNLKAIGIGMDVRTIPPGSKEKCDAICIRLEHRDGEAIDVFQPYHRDQGGIAYGQVFASQGSPNVFAKS